MDGLWVVALTRRGCDKQIRVRRCDTQGLARAWVDRLNAALLAADLRAGRKPDVRTFYSVDHVHGWLRDPCDLTALLGERPDQQ